MAITSCNKGLIWTKTDSQHSTGSQKMPARRQPKTLKVAALGAVTRLVTYQVQVMMTTSIQRHNTKLASIGDVMSSLPEAVARRVADQGLGVADQFLTYRNNHPGRRLLGALLESLLPDGTRSFHLERDLSYQMRMALIQRLAVLGSLRDLRLAASLYSSASCSTGPTIAGLSGMPHLVVLSAPDICSDEMTAALGQYCPLLRVLNATDSPKVTDASVGNLAGCADLRVVLLPGCSVSVRGYERLLRSFPCLEEIGRCENLSKIVRRVGGTLELTKFESDHLPDNAVLAHCPKVETLVMDDVNLQPTRGGVSVGDGVRMLLVRAVGVRDHPKQLRVELGPSLVHLEVEEYFLSLADVEEIGRMCPRLRVLRLRLMTGPLSEPLVGLGPGREPAHAPFQSLQELTLHSGPGPLLEYVLTHARNIQRVTVLPGLCTDCFWTDEHMRRVCAANPMRRLQALHIATPCALTMDTVYLLLGCCPDLRSLLDLGEWRVSGAERDMLVELITVNNWDLETGQTAAGLVHTCRL